MVLGRTRKCTGIGFTNAWSIGCVVAGLNNEPRLSQTYWNIVSRPRALQYFIIDSISNSRKRRMSRAFTDNVNSFNVSNTIILTAADYELKILAWLSPLDPHVRHQDICGQRVDSIGDWLLETKEFRDWYNGSEIEESDHPALFCYGDPGVGKSYIR